MSKILPCKKHGITPQWVEQEMPHWANLNAIAARQKPVRKLVCHLCQRDEEEAKNQPAIDDWNKKQEAQK